MATRSSASSSARVNIFPHGLDGLHTTTARVFLNFSRLPATRSVTQPDGSHRVRLVDVRFVGGPFQFEDEPQMRPPFVATVVIAPGGAVLREGLGP